MSQLKQLNQIASVLMGQSPSSSSCSEDGPGLPFIQGNAEFGTRYPMPKLRCSIPTRISEEGDFLLSVRAPVGELNQSNLKMVIGRGLSAIRFPDYDQPFSWHSLKSAVHRLNRVAQGSTFVAVSRYDVECLEIPWFSEDSYRQNVAYVLDTVDEAIARTEAVIAKFKQVRAGMLHDLLSYGLDESGKLRDPIAHPEQFKESQLGRIPRDWKVSRIEDVSEKVQDGTHFSPKSNSGPRRYLTSKNIRLGYLDLTDCGWISENEHRGIFRRCDVRKNDVLLTKDGANTGNAAINILDDDFSLLSSVAFMRGKEGQLISEYLLNYLLSPVSQKRIKDLVSGNAITRLTLKKIKDFTIPVPGHNEQKMIAAHLKKCTQNISAYEAELESHKNIKSGLQDDLLTGRVRVPETIREGVAGA